MLSLSGCFNKVCGSHICSPPQIPDVVPRDALLDISRDNYLSRVSNGGISGAEFDAIARPEPREDTEENRIRGGASVSEIGLRTSRGPAPPFAASNVCASNGSTYALLCPAALLLRAICRLAKNVPARALLFARQPPSARRFF